MPLTILQLFKQYSEITWFRKIYVKKYNPVTGNFDDPNGWVDISNYLIENSVQSISLELPKDNYSYGKVIISNCQLELKNIYGELSDETNSNSIFYGGFQRHNSQIQIVEGYVDDKTDPKVPVQIMQTVFTGVIDDQLAETTMNYTERFIAQDFINVLKRYTKGTLTTQPVGTDINTVVYQILNQAIFTKYFNVSNSSTYINAGYNATSFDWSQYTNDQTILEILQDIAFGHSIFYINPSDNYFYFLTVTPTPTVQYDFSDILAKRIKIDKYMTGADKIIEDWYWDSTNLSKKAATHKYFTSNTMNIKGVTDATQRQNMLNYVQALTSASKLNFDVIIPYFPLIKLLDRVTFTRTGPVPDDSFLLDIGRLDIDVLREPVGAISLTPADAFYIRSIKHNKLQTTFHVQHV